MIEKEQQYPSALKQQEINYIVFLQSYRLQFKPPLLQEQKLAFICKFDQQIMQTISKILNPAQKFREQNQQFQRKALLYSWQIFNLRGLCLNKNEKLNKTLEQYLQKLTLRTFKRKGNAILCEKVLKNLHICFFNMIKNQQISVYQMIKNQNSLLKMILFNSLNQQQTGKQPKIQLEWLVYLFQQCNNRYEGFCKQLCKNQLLFQQSLNFSSKLLHFMSLLLGKMIDQRCTTQIVKGYQSPLQQIRDMYNQKQKAINYKISWTDYEWVITQVLKDNYTAWKAQLIKIYQDENHTYNRTYIDCLLSVMGIVNCCVFLGGYNKHIQLPTTNSIMSIMLELLQISYLIYEICHAPKKSQKVTLQGQFTNNLAKILGIDNGQKQSKIVLPLQNGQLVAILRVFSNLVHINSDAQKYFQDNLQYFRMVMCLTHENQNQITMKQWSIVFLRNVAERSQILRAQLQKLKIDVKVDMGTPLM